MDFIVDSRSGVDRAIVPLHLAPLEFSALKKRKSSI